MGKEVEKINENKKMEWEKLRPRRLQTMLMCGLIAQNRIR